MVFQTTACAPLVDFRQKSFLVVYVLDNGRHPLLHLLAVPSMDAASPYMYGSCVAGHNAEDLADENATHTLSSVIIRSNIPVVPEQIQNAFTVNLTRRIA